MPSWNELWHISCLHCYTHISTQFTPSFSSSYAHPMHWQSERLAQHQVAANSSKLIMAQSDDNFVYCSLSLIYDNFPLTLCCDDCVRVDAAHHLFVAERTTITLEAHERTCTFTNIQYDMLNVSGNLRIFFARNSMDSDRDAEIEKPNETISWSVCSL